MDNNYLIIEKDNLIEMKKSIISLKHDFKINKANLKEEYKTNKKTYRSEINKIKQAYKKELKLNQKEYKKAKIKFNNEYNKFKKEVLAKKNNDIINNTEIRLALALTPITELSYANMSNEFNKLKKVKRSYKKYDNKPILTREEKKARALNKIDYKREHDNLKKAFKCGIILEKNNLSKDKNYKDTYVKYRSLSRVYDTMHYLLSKLIYLVKVDHLSFARVIVTLFSVLSLALSLSFIRAIQQVTNNWTGLFMFAFILFGLISIFNVIRLKEAYSLKTFFVLGILALTVICGLVLIILTISGIQKGIRLNRVYEGIIVTAIISVGYCIGIFYILLAYFKERKQFRESMV